MLHSIATPQLNLIGEIKGANGFGVNRLFCKWSFKYGKHFTVFSGNTSGETFEEVKTDWESSFYWDHPFDIHFRVSSMRGWPKIMVEVWEISEEGKYTIAGYGVGTVPCSPGNHKLLINCWRPVDNSWWGSVSEYLLGTKPEISIKDMIISSTERNGFETESTGTVEIEIGVISKNFELYGVKCS